MGDRRCLKGYWWNSLISLLLILLNFNLAAQNLVPNPSFEEYDSLICSGRIGAEIATDFGDISDQISFWNNPTDLASDLYSKSVSDSCNLNPTFIDIKPNSGGNYTELITFWNKNPNNPTSSNVRSYLQSPLVDMIASGKLVKSIFFVKTKDSLNLYDFWAKEYRWNVFSFTNNLGMYFSKDSLNFKTPPDADRPYLMPIPVEPQVEEKKVILPSDGWYQISSCFMANEDYNFVTIGNFRRDSATTFSGPGLNSGLIARYFIDDVSVEVLLYNIAQLEKEIEWCEGDPPPLIDAAVAGATSYRWVDGSTDSSFLFSFRGEASLSVDINFPECTYTHTFQVRYFPALDLGPDITACEGTEVILQHFYPSLDFRWDDGSAASSRIITQSGTYFGFVPGSSCQVADSIQVQFLPCLGEIPNIFTPNDDGINDTFFIPNLEITPWRLQIFNRWGVLVYQQDNYQGDWDARGLADGIYFYSLSSQELNQTIKGWVHVKRF